MVEDLGDEAPHDAACAFQVVPRGGVPAAEEAERHGDLEALEILSEHCA